MSRSELETQLKTIVPANFPSFIFIRDTSGANIAQSTLKDVLSQLQRDAPAETVFAIVDCIACFTQRILFDSILYALLECLSDSDAETKINVLVNQKNDTIDDFLHNIKSLFPTSTLSFSSSSTGANSDPIKVVLVLEQAERLKETLPRLIHPFSRLQELTKLNVTTIFVSEGLWETITPISGTLSDPYIIEVDALDRQDIIERICDAFQSEVSRNSISMHNPSLGPLFRHFVEAVYDVCSPFISNPTELAYIAAARWPGFVSPVLEEWRQQEDGPYVAPSEEARIRLLRLFNLSLMNAVENLYPRSIGRSEWSAANSFPPGFRLSDVKRGAQLPSATTSSEDPEDSTLKLSTLSMFIVLSAFLASYNPAKTDFRMLGRGAGEKSRRRRKGGGTRKTKPGTVSKLPQRLVGPMSFSYDRLVAILGSLLREYDDAKQIGQTLEDISELKAEVDVHRVQISASIRELISMHLLHRTNAQEKLEGISLRCGIGYDQALSVARKLGIPLNELMWEPT